MDSDKALILRVKQGCPDSMRQLYERYKDDLLTLANALLNDIASAEDVVHDVFVAFAADIEGFQLRKSLKGYFVTCVRNRSRDRLRTRTRNAEKHAQLTVPDADHNSPAQLAVAAETAQLVRDALGQLPIDQREAVVLHLRGQMTFRQVAALQDVSVNTVQGRYRYGIKKLRSLLQEQVNS